MDFSHQPVTHSCPFCRVVAGEDVRDHYTKQTDIVFRDGNVTAFISSAWWPRNAGHVLVVPNEHYENIYDIPDSILGAVQIVGKLVAMAMRATYECDGTSFRQHNEPAGYQEVWHYHLHVFPRYHGDDLYILNGERRDTTPSERAQYAARLRSYLSRQSAQ